MPVKTSTTNGTEMPLTWGPVYVTDEEFCELERAQRHPVQPTKSIIEGAELLRRLYGKLRSR